MSKIEMTAQQIKDLELWDKVCDYKGINPSDDIEEEEIIEFDTRFEKDIIKNNIALEKVNLQIISNNLFGITNDVNIYEMEGNILLKELEESYDKLGELLQRVKDNSNLD